MADIRMVKKELRNKYRQLRENMKPEMKELYNQQIFEQLIASKLYQDAKMILCFMSKGIEVDTIKIINQAFADNKTVAVPKCLDLKGNMQFYIIQSFADLEESTYSLMEPDTIKCPKLIEYENSICIVPGFAFDKNGYRIGFGKGFYDRFLSKYGGIKAAICYNICIANQLPHGRYDVAVNYIITQKYILSCDHEKT